MIAIDAHAGGGDAEDDRGAAIEKGVERDQDVLGLIDVVAASERRLDAAVLAEHPRADVQRVVVVGEAARPSHRSARAPSIGSFWMKSVIGVAFCHTSSSRRPSTRIDPFGTRVAVACLRLADPVTGVCADADEASAVQNTDNAGKTHGCGESR